MMPTSSITMMDIAFVFFSAVVLCEVLRIVVVGIRNLQASHDDTALHQQNWPGESPDGA
jgi:hypothetical protein